MSANALGGGGNPLPESFEEFADTRVCENCGDRVDVEYIEAGECVGCRYGGESQ